MFKLWQQGEVQSIIFFDDEGRLHSVPTDPANQDYQQYLAWVEEGNVAEEWDPEAN